MCESMNYGEGMDVGELWGMMVVILCGRFFNL